MRRLALFAALLAACSGPVTPVPATEVILIVDATPSVRRQTDHLQVEISGAVLRDGPYTGTVVQGYGPPAADVGYPRHFGLVPAGGDPKRFFEAHATAFDASGARITEALVRSSYIEHQLLELRIVLDDACRAVSCPDGQVCRHGACQDIFVDPGVLPQADAGPPPPLDGSVVDLGSAADGGPLPDGAPAADADVADGAPPTDLGPAGCTTFSCDDSDPCNGVERCIEGHCAPGTLLSCDDGVFCTDDSCAAGTGCTHAPNDANCTAAGPGTCSAVDDCQYATCTTSTCGWDSMTCTMGSCVGSTCNRMATCTASQSCCGGACVALGCDDGNPCTDDSCASGACQHLANSAPCTDGDACTVGDHCAGSVCVSGGCDDGNPCTMGDSCVAGACTGGVNVVNGTVCDDANLCTNMDHCHNGNCVATTVVCDTSLDTDCVGHACNPANGICEPTNFDGAYCTNESLCRTGTCNGGFCQLTGGGCNFMYEVCCTGVCESRTPGCL